ncbi:MAG: DUF3604 domain-containing protein [Fuerstiella sp.]|nr:DUF3604 domain-containing protein [Fuerstiella sp.]
MSQSKPDTCDLGRITCSLRGSVVAGSWQTCMLKYTAGFSGIDDTGSLKIVTRYATDSGIPQFDDPAAPNYTTVVASNGAHLQLRYDVKDFRRPWGRTIHLKVLQGYLRKGDVITLTIGDTSGGSSGWRMQTFAEDTFELKTLVDRYATYVYEELPKSPTFKVVAGKPVRLVAVAPSQAIPGKKIPVRWKLEDVWGNPVGRSRRMSHSGLPESIHRIKVTDEVTGLWAETNPVYVSADAVPRYWADLHGQSEETIGTNSIERYFRFARDSAFVDACGHQGNDFQITDAFWQTINDTTARFNQPGKFVTFPGWEWSGNTALGGDRNVFFKEEGGAIGRSSRALVEPTESAGSCCPAVENLFDRMEQEQQHCDVMLVPHVGGRYADLARHHAGLEPVVEVHSAWGTFEWVLDDAFSRGYRVGIVANSDGHKGRPGASYPGAGKFGSYGGLTAVLSDTLDRNAVWAAYQQRRVYATTGARILLDVQTAAGHSMGEVVRIGNDESLGLSVTVAGTAPLERVEVRNGMRVLKTLRTYSKSDLTNRIKVLWQGAQVRGRGRQVNWDGSLSLDVARIDAFQTINFWNPEKNCEQLSRQKLRWESVTTGGVAGVILDLNRLSGSLHVETSQRSLNSDISKLGVRGRSYSAGGIGKQISACRLPPAGGARDISTTVRIDPKDLCQGDNPIYICVVQEDGHMAWSSPIYAVM